MLGVDATQAQKWLSEGLTANEVADALHVAKSSVTKMMRDERITPKRMAQRGSQTRYWFDVWSVIAEKERREPQEVI